MEDEKYIKVVFWGCSEVGCYKLMGILINEQLFSLGFTKFIKINNKHFNISFSIGSQHERFRGLNKIIIRGSDIMIFVYDITSIKSFDELKDYYIPRAFEILDNNFKGAIVGINYDLYMYEQVRQEKAKHLADSYGFKFILTSEKYNGDNFREFNGLSEIFSYIEKFFLKNLLYVFFSNKEKNFRKLNPYIYVIFLKN